MGTTVDWNRWLPPRKIRDRGDLEFKVGQVWAWRYGDDPIVFRVLQYGRGKDASVRVDGLAREKYSGEGPVAMRANGCYVLVQDTGQSEPTPPDVLWQEAYALPPDICYAPDVCTSVRVMGRDDHGKAYCWKHRALWGTVTRDVEDDRSIKTMFESIRKSADEIMMGVFREAGMLGDRPAPRRLTSGDQAWLSADGLIRAPCDGRPDCKCDLVMAGCAVAKEGNGVVWVSAASGARGLMAFKLGAPHEWDLSALVEHSTDTDFFGDPKAPLTMEALQKAYEAMNDIVMSGFTAPMKLPPWESFDSYRYQPVLDDRPRSHASTKPIPKSEKEIYQLQKLNDGDRKRVELFPVIREGAPRTQSQSIAAGLGIWGTRGDAKVQPEPKPYPNVSDEDLLKDA